jgi:hypothetical protein
MRYIVEEQPDFQVLPLDSLSVVDLVTNVLRECLPDEPHLELSELHESLDPAQLNTYRMEVISRVNSLPLLKKCIYDGTYRHISRVLGQDLAIQRKANISIQLPFDDSSILSKHIDPRSGDSPFQYVIWIPITDSFGTNAMHIYNDGDSSYRPVELRTGSFLLFFPCVPHGNVINKTNHTRISLNIRVKNWFAPDYLQASDRQFGLYYEDFVFSRNTIRGFSLYDA